MPIMIITKYPKKELLACLSAILIDSVLNSGKHYKHSMQGWTAITRYGVTKKRKTKILKHTGNMFRKNLHLKDVCKF